MCIATPITVNAFLIDVSYSRATFSLEMLDRNRQLKTGGSHQGPAEFSGIRVH